MTLRSLSLTLSPALLCTQISPEMTFPKVKGNYKGIAPMPQMMRKKGVAPPPVPGSAAEKKLNEEKAAEEAKAMEEAEGKKMVQEMAEPGSETLPAPCYTVEPRCIGKAKVKEGGAVSSGVSGSGAGGGASADASGVEGGGESEGEASSAKADALSIKVHLPDVSDEAMSEYPWRIKHPPVQLVSPACHTAHATRALPTRFLGLLLMCPCALARSAQSNST